NRRMRLRHRKVVLQIYLNRVRVVDMENADHINEPSRNMVVSYAANTIVKIRCKHRHRAFPGSMQNQLADAWDRTDPCRHRSRDSTRIANSRQTKQQILRSDSRSCAGFPPVLESSDRALALRCHARRVETGRVL